MRILLTAYGPFGDVKENVTEEIANVILDDWNTDDGELKTLHLPVVWEKARAMLVGAIDDFAPDVIVSLGHAAGYPEPTIETRYFNTAIGADASGAHHLESVIDQGGPDSIDTNIDATKLLQHLKSKALPARVHQGVEGMNYLCNFAGYVTMGHLKKTGKTTPFIFIHLPPASVQIPLATLVRVVRETLVKISVTPQTKVPHECGIC